MIIRGLSSLGVTIAMGGLLWSVNSESAAALSGPAVPAAPAPLADVEVVAETAPEREAIAQYVEALKHKIDVLREEGRFDEAKEFHRQASQRLAGLRGTDPPRRGLPHVELADVHEQISGHLEMLHEKIAVLHEKGHHEEAEQCEHQAQALIEVLERAETPVPPRRVSERGRPAFPDAPPHRFFERDTPLPPDAPAPRRELFERQMQVERLHEKIAKLHELGLHDVAEDNEHRVQELMELLERSHGHAPMPSAEHQEAREHFEQLHQEMAELHEMGRHEDAERLFRHAQELMVTMEEHGGHGPHPIHEDEHFSGGGMDAGKFEARIHHLVQAAENLEAAGLDDYAEELRGQAEEMERMLRKHPGDEDEDDWYEEDERFDELMHEVHELRGDVHELIDLVRGLHHRLDELAERH